MNQDVYDLLGVGFGPANLALAVAIQEAGEKKDAQPINSVFIERKEQFMWHPNMLLQGMRVQVPFLKDLATLRNPQSRFTFLKYLQDKGRLDEFINTRELYPTRIEFNDYYRWAALQFSQQVCYAEEVTAIQALRNEERDEVTALKVIVRNVQSGKVKEYHTRNVVVATGGVPSLPPGVTSKRVFHSCELLSRLQRDFAQRDEPYRFVVVGSGQSAAEILYYLISNYRNADVTATIRRYAYQPTDDSFFANQLYFPQHVNFFYNLSDTQRKEFLARNQDSLYAVVDLDLIEKIYKFLYEERVSGRQQARIISFMDFIAVEDVQDDKVRLQLRDMMQDQSVYIEADAVIFATGYTHHQPHSLLRELDRYLQLEDNSNNYKITRDYQIASHKQFHPKIFLQGFCETTHGFSETVVSLMPIRSAEIVSALQTSGVH